MKILINQNNNIHQHHSFNLPMRLYILPAFFLMSCTSRNTESIPNPEIEFINAECEPNKINTPGQIEGNFKALYYGPKMDHIIVDLSKSYSQLDMFTHFNEVMGIFDFNITHLIITHPRYPSKDDASLYIDTSQIIQTDLLVNEFKTAFTKKVICTSHYPIIIENKHVSFFAIGYGDELDLTFEALDQTSQWKPISHAPMIFCGTGLMSVPLSSQEIAISALPITDGQLQTKGRVRMGKVLSNEISIRIDSTAFQPPY